MITLKNAHIQDVSSNPIVPNGYMELCLNADATVIASPYGQVMGGTNTVYGFDTRPSSPNANNDGFGGCGT